MDVVTHVLAGACVAQIPNLSTRHNSTLNLSFYQRAIIGGIAAIFPDIDYLLFFWNPLEFLAYWHRAESHSVLLAPLWALLLTNIWTLSLRFKQFRLLIFWVCMLSLLSHTLIDSLSTYGTQWFAPFSEYRIAWNLLFVVDGYFTICLAITLFWMYFKQNKKRAFFVFLLPLSYLFFAYQIKLTTHQEVTSDSINKPSNIILLPQPFSPLYWQVIRTNKGNIKQAYVRLANDPVASLISNLLGKKLYQDNYQPLQQLRWRDYSLTPQSIPLQAEVSMVWKHQSFKAFRDFAVYPIYYSHKKVGVNTCIWFSDLRYHWPDFSPSFRYGMCREEETWAVYRMTYLTSDPVRLNQ